MYICWNVIDFQNSTSMRRRKIYTIHIPYSGAMFADAKNEVFSTSPFSLSLSLCLLISCQYIKYDVHRIYIAFSQSFSLLCVDYLFIYYDTGIVYIARALPVKVKKMTRACTSNVQSKHIRSTQCTTQHSTAQHNTAHKVKLSQMS